jgi:RND family efflux transporter MFP subunit
MKAPSHLKYIYLFLAIGLFSCAKKESGKQEPKEAFSKTQTVQVVKPMFRSIVPTLKITGKAMANRKVEVYAMESGRVVKVYKDLGDKVSKGTALVLLENPEIEATVAKAKAEQSRAQSKYKRLKSSRQNASALTPISLVEEAQAKLEKASAELELIIQRKNELTIRAPFAGIVTKRMVEQGATLQNALKNTSSQAIFEIQEPNPIRLTIDVPGSDLTKISKGMAVNISFSGLKESSYQAKITRMANALDPMSNTMTVEIDIANASHAIKPGMYAEVEIELEETDKVLSIQSEALLMFKKEAYVLAVRKDKVLQLPLQRGAANKKYFEIKNEDISKDDLIIVRGKNLVKNGEVVKAIIAN